MHFISLTHELMHWWLESSPLEQMMRIRMIQSSGAIVALSNGQAIIAENGKFRHSQNAVIPVPLQPMVPNNFLDRIDEIDTLEGLWGTCIGIAKKIRC